jgi:hypothetical protein
MVPGMTPHRCARARSIWLAAIVAMLAARPALAGKYRLSVGGEQILLNGRPVKVIGLRCSNALMSDATTKQLVDHLDEFRSYGVNTVSVFFMGSRFGDVKGYRPDASLDPAHAARMGRIIEAADERGMIVVVGCLYWSTSRAKEGLGDWTQADADRAVANTVRWLKEHDYRNVFVDVDNEGMAHDATGWSIAGMIDAAHAVDPTIMVAYNDSDPPPANADLLVHHSRAVPGRPWVQTEGTPGNAPGGYWGTYSKRNDVYNYINIGVYSDAMKADQLRQTDRDIARYSGHMLASTWLQCVPPHGPNQRPGGDGSEKEPGIRWWLEHVKANHGGRWMPPPPAVSE